VKRSFVCFTHLVFFLKKRSPKEIEFNASTVQKKKEIEPNASTDADADADAHTHAHTYPQLVSVESKDVVRENLHSASPPPASTASEKRERV